MLLSLPSYTHPVARVPSPLSILARRIDLEPKRHRDEVEAILKPVSIGIAVAPSRSSSHSSPPSQGDDAQPGRKEKSGHREDEERGPEYSVTVSDGTSVVRSEHAFAEPGLTWDACLMMILGKAKMYAAKRGHKIEMVALARNQSSMLPHATYSAPDSTASRSGSPSASAFLDAVWFSLDAIPFLASSEAAANQFSLDSQAQAALDEALECLIPLSGSTVKIQFDKERQVLVDANHRVQLYSLATLKSITSPSLWSAFVDTGESLVERKVKVGFFSATPRGGGVALMRHSLVRLWDQVGLDVKWYVPPGDAGVWNVTKRKFHNILQGVADPSTLLTINDKHLFERWTEFYYRLFWAKGDGEFLKQFDVIVIDDPQLTGLIPIIRRVSPRTKIVFRSHIQIRADLIDSRTQQQSTTWDYLWHSIKLVDLFVAHPVEAFVPQVVKDTLPVVYMPPCTSPLDGLNKPIAPHYVEMYQQEFDKATKSTSGNTVAWSRGYMGIPDLVEGYRLFRQEYDQKTSSSGFEAPQLVMTGHSSVDDPDGTVVFSLLHEQLGRPEFDEIRKDIFAVRAPSSDRLLNAVLRSADVVCQVSTREGYEIKVTEAIHKRKWVIATNAGGIPLQVREGIDGTIVEPGDPAAIARALLAFYEKQIDHKVAPPEPTPAMQTYDETLVGGRSDDGGPGPSERDLGLGNATMWQALWIEILGVNGFEDGTVSLEASREQTRKRLEKLNGKKVWDVIADKMRA
ncbi:hypothetical protein JCM10212_002638 [Sporobolomyces blumeae]